MMKALMSLTMLLCSLCSMGQKMFITEQTYNADVLVCVVEHEYRADLVVYITDRSYTSGIDDNEGIWYFTDRSYNADKKISYVPEYRADIKIMFTDKKYRAGWRNESKRYLMD